MMRHDAKTNAAIGRRLKLLRLAFGKTQEEMGKIVGVSTGMISMCEKGKARLSIDYTIKLLFEFGAPLEWFYLGMGRYLPNELRRKLDLVSAEMPESPQRAPHEQQQHGAAP